MKSKLKTYEIPNYMKKSCLYYLKNYLDKYSCLYNSTYVFSQNCEMVKIEFNYLKHIKIQIEMENELEEVFAPTETVSGTLSFPVFIFKLIVDKEDAEILQHVVNCMKDEISWHGGGEEDDKAYVFFRIPADEHIKDDYVTIQKIVMEFSFKRLDGLKKWK